LIECDSIHAVLRITGDGTAANWRECGSEAWRFFRHIRHVQTDKISPILEIQSSDVTGTKRLNCRLEDRLKLSSANFFSFAEFSSLFIGKTQRRRTKQWQPFLCGKAKPNDNREWSEVRCDNVTRRQVRAPGRFNFEHREHMQSVRRRYDGVDW